MRVLVVVLALCVCGAVGDESRTYMNLWGSLLNGRNGTLAAVSNKLQGGLQSAADSLFQRLADYQQQRQNGSSSASASAILAALLPNSTATGFPFGATNREAPSESGILEAQSKLLQRLADYYSSYLQRQGQGQAAAGPSAVGSGDQVTAAAPGPLRALPMLNLTDATGDGSASSGSTFSGLLQRLKADFSSMDHHQLAAVAMLQGWALAALLAGKSAGMGGAGSSLSGVTGSIMGSKRSAGGSSGSLGSLSARDRVVQMADPSWAAFSPAACIGLQNFGGAEGYRAVFLGPPPCGSPGSAAESELAWGSTAAFLLECQPAEAAPAEELKEASSSAGSGEEAAAEPAGAAAGAAGSGSSGGGGGSESTAGRALLSSIGGSGALGQLLGVAGAGESTLSKLSLLLRGAGSVADEGAGQLQCRLAVASNGGGGAVLRFGEQLGPRRQALPFQGELNAVSVRVCNIAPSTLQRPTAAPTSLISSSIALRDLHIGGRPALKEPLVGASSQLGAGNCTTQLFWLGGKGASKAVSVSGWVDLVDDGGFGVGEQASVVISVGEYHD